VLLGPGEPDHRPGHPLISQAPVPPLDGAVLSLLDAGAPREELIRVLRWLAESPALSSPGHPAGKGGNATRRLRQRTVVARDHVQAQPNGRRARRS
jgi:hypothetical protein